MWRGLQSARAGGSPPHIAVRSWLLAEVDFRRFTRFRLVRFEVLLRREARHRRHDARREPADGGVVLLRDFVVAMTLDGDAVLRSLELRLQVEEILIRFQVGIALDDDK